MKQSTMWNYLNEQPETLKALLASDQIDRFLADYDPANLKRIVVMASGSSLNIALIAKRFFEELAGIEVVTYTPFDFLGNSKIVETFDRETTLAVAISQTGTSSGTVRSITKAKELGFSVLSITERTNTAAEQLGDHYLNFLSGLEDCNAKTKGVSHSLMVLILLSLQIGRKKEIVDDALYESYQEELTASINDIPETIRVSAEWVEANKDWSAISQLLVIGGGTNYGSAVEGALKLLETICVLGAACETGEFSHGLHRTISCSSNVIAIHTEEYGQEDMEKTIDYLRDTAGRLLVVNASSTEAENDDTINIAHRPLTASCLNILVAFQVLAALLPEVLGYDPNRPSNNELTELLHTRV